MVKPRTPPNTSASPAAKRAATQAAPAVASTSKTPYRVRAATIGAMDHDARTVELVCSTEQPVMVGPNAYEILTHRASSVRLTRFQNKAPLLHHHDWARQIGVVEQANIQDNQLVATVRFSRNDAADAVYQDIADGIANHVSIGYRNYKVVERRGKTERTREYCVTDWEPFEVSIVAVPADTSAGVVRSAADLLHNPSHNPDLPSSFSTLRDPAMSDFHAHMNDTMNNTLNDPNTDITAIRDAERTRVAGIHTLARQFPKALNETAAQKAISEGTELSEVHARVLAELAKPHKTASSATYAESLADYHVDMSARDLARYSITRAVRAMSAGHWDAAGLEREVSREIQKRTGRERGVSIPLNIVFRAQSEQDASTATSSLIANTLLPNQYIEALREHSVTAQLGIRILDGLRGQVSLPKQTSKTEFDWISEDENAPLTTYKTGTVSLRNRTVAGRVTITRDALMQSTPSIDALVEEDMRRGIAGAIDRAILNGGVDNTKTPTGIFQLPGTSEVALKDAAKPAWAEIVKFKTALAKNAALNGSLHWVMAPEIYGELESTAKDAGSGVFLLNDHKLNGFAAHMSNHAPENGIVFGDFSQWILGLWGGVDMVVDAVSSNSGSVSLKLFQTADCGCRHVEAFAIGKAAE